MKQRRVVCAAVQQGNLIICSPRHFDMTTHTVIKALRHENSWHHAQQGFVDQWGKFMSREEAFDVATAAGQIIEKSGNANSKELYSEDIY